MPDRPLSRNSTRVACVPTATISVGALVVGEQHRDVLAGAGRGEDHRLEAELLHPLQPGRAAVAVGVDHDLGAAAQRLVGHRVHVADDQVRAGGRPPAARRPRRRPPISTGRYSRMYGRSVGQVVLVVVAADDDQHVPAVEPGRDVGDADAVEQQLALAAQELHRVRRERLELHRQPGPGLGHRGGDGLGGLHDALGHQPVARRRCCRRPSGPARPPGPPASPRGRRRRSAGCPRPPGSRDRGWGSARSCSRRR